MSVTIPAGTVYMFSCNKCHTAESKGSPADGSTLQRVADPSGIFHCFLIRNGLISLEVAKGYYGFNPEKSIFPLTQEEGEGCFGVHACGVSTLESKTTETPQDKTKTRKLLRRKIEPGVTVLDGGPPKPPPRRFETL